MKGDQDETHHLCLGLTGLVRILANHYNDSYSGNHAPIGQGHGVLTMAHSRLPRNSRAEPGLHNSTFGTIPTKDTQHESYINSPICFDIQASDEFEAPGGRLCSPAP